MTAGPTEIWLIIVLLGIGTFALRFSFLGLLGDRPLPGWAQKLLRYTPVAGFPGLVAPLVVWPAATGGTFDPPRVLAAAATIGVAVVTRNLLAAILAGAGTLYLGLWLL